jgi:hypothetical protein
MCSLHTSLHIFGECLHIWRPFPSILPPAATEAEAPGIITYNPRSIPTFTQRFVYLTNEGEVKAMFRGV